MTFVPAAVALFIGDKVNQRESRLMQWAERGYRRLLSRSLAQAPVVFTGAAVRVVFCAAVGTRLGSEFVPKLNEGDSWPTRRRPSRRA